MPGRGGAPAPGGSGAAIGGGPAAAPIATPSTSTAMGNAPMVTVPRGPISIGWCGGTGRPLSWVPLVEPRSVT